MTLPMIGTPERDALESKAIEMGDRELERQGDIARALSRLRIQLSIESGEVGVGPAAAVELAEHVEQCWITRILR